MKWFRLVFLASMTLALFYLLNFPHGQKLPFAPGEFFNPFAGFWQNNLRSDRIPEKLHLTGLADSVIVRWDDRRVPHVFARNAHDLYFTQGYLTARERLWQMDFLVRAAAGRISEIIGPDSALVEYDRYRRRIGIVYAAENALKTALEDDASRLALNAYTAGVNAWIERLETRDIPVEFKILHYRPELWTPLKSALLLKHMAWELTGYSEETLHTRLRAALGDSLMEELYFPASFLAKPVIPAGTPWNFRPLPQPAPPETLFQAFPLRSPGLSGLTRHSPFSFSDIQLAIGNLGGPNPANGSNNWAVSGKKTRSGYPILCSDPHLGLTLPSIWYEIQLSSPEVNVYGVSLPGAPTVVIGFNRHIAWGMTNAHTDVLDWYQVEFNLANPREYRYQAEWRTAKQRLEKIAVRGGQTLIDTLLITREGLVVFQPPQKTASGSVISGMALRWAGHDPSNELAASLKLNRAANYREFMQALADHDCPGQNYAFAGSDGDIAIIHRGKFPLRWKGEGRFVGDARNPAYHWRGWIPGEHLPGIKNPPPGFVASANQVPVDSTYPYFLNGKYAPFDRSRRIFERLSEMENITVQDMMALQTDILNQRARTLLPGMLDILERQDISLAEATNIEVLRAWNLENRRDAPAPIIFESWWENLHRMTWEDEIPAENGTALLPREEATIDLLLRDTASVFFDIRGTEEPETLGDILLLSFGKTHEELTRRFGAFGEGWNWGKARGTEIPHLARLKGFGREGLETDGNHDIVNAIKKAHGPSWRMVVELGPRVKAWGIYPGGQSGNPGSAHYDEFVNDWVNGKYYELLYLQSAAETHPRLIAKTVLRGGK